MTWSNAMSELKYFPFSLTRVCMCFTDMFVHVCSCCRCVLEQVADNTSQDLQTPPPEEEEEEEVVLSLKPHPLKMKTGAKRCHP